MPKKEKVELLENIKSNFKEVDGLVVADFKGLTVLQLDDLRRKVEGEGGKAKVYKNSLLEKAFDGIDMKGMTPFLKENSIVVFSQADMMKVLKPVADYAKANEKFIIKGGYLDGRAMDKNGVMEMSKLPGRKELLSMVVGSMNSVISSFVGTLNSVLQTFVGTVEALEKKKK